jgi:hypothetical protein
MMTITVKYLAPTAHKGSRVKAYVAGCKEPGTVTQAYDNKHSAFVNAEKVAQELENKIAREYHLTAHPVIGWEYTPDVWLFVPADQYKSKI